AGGDGADDTGDAGSALSRRRPSGNRGPSRGLPRIDTGYRSPGPAGRTAGGNAAWPSSGGSGVGDGRSFSQRFRVRRRGGAGAPSDWGLRGGGGPRGGRRIAARRGSVV